MSRESIEKVLRSLGLTEKEIEIYVFLARHGIMRSVEITRGVKFYRTEVYRILKNLQVKGLVLATLEAPARFKAAPFEDVLDAFIKAKREEAARIEETKHNLLSDWEDVKRRVPEPEVETFAVIEGKQKINSKIMQMLQETNNNFSALLPIQVLLQPDGFGLLDVPSKLEVGVRLLTGLSEDKLSSVRSLKKRIQESGFAIRARNPEMGLQLSQSMVIRDNKDLLFFISPRTDTFSFQESVCFWTNCKELVDSFVVVFEDLWRNSLEIESRISESKIGGQVAKSFVIYDERTAERKYDEALNSAKQEILAVTSSDGLIRLSESKRRLEEIAGKGVSIKVLAPLTGENLKAATALSGCCDVRHAPPGWLATTIFDARDLYQFKIPSQVQHTGARQSESVLYSNDAKFVEANRKIIYSLWKNSRPLSNAPLDSIIESSAPGEDPYRGKLLGRVIDEKPPGSITEKDILDKIFDGKRYLAPRGWRDTVRYYGSSAMGVIYPPAQFNLPDVLFNVIHCNKHSSFGAEDWILISLRLETTEGNKYVPVVHVTDNPKAARARKPLFAGSPTSASVQIMKEHELQVHVQGNILFAGWTSPIPLPILNKTIPPAGLLFQGYGDVRSGAVTRLSRRGRRQEIEYNRMEAFLTFFHPASKYSGPGIDAFFERELIFTSYPPSKN